MFNVDPYQIDFYIYYMKIKLFIITILIISFQSCSNGGVCDCVQTVKEDGVTVNSNTYTDEDGSPDCARSRGWVENVNGVEITTTHNCTYKD